MTTVLTKKMIRAAFDEGNSTPRPVKCDFCKKDFDWVVHLQLIDNRLSGKSCYPCGLKKFTELNG